MLEVGNGALSFTQSRTHFAFWAAMKSPLIIGTDLTKLSQANIGILQNKYLLSFNQDPVFGAPAMPYKWGTNPDWTFNASFPAEYWSGRSKNGTLVLMLNIGAAAKNMTAQFEEIPGLSRRGGGALRVVDAWTDVELGRFEESVEVEVAGYDTTVLLVKG
jgi:alpha-galactosidase